MFVVLLFWSEGLFGRCVVVVVLLAFVLVFN